MRGSPCAACGSHFDRVKAERFYARVLEELESLISEALQNWRSFAH